MPIEDFFHEVAFNQMNAGRGQFAPKVPWWRRGWRLLTPAVRRGLLGFAVLSLGTGAYLYRGQILVYLRSQPAHGPGAADTLTFVTHRSLPHERMSRLAVACAREDNAGECQAALQKLLALTDTATAAKTLQFPEIRALRANEFFNRFALEVESQQKAPVPRP
ncbi:MAG: hypothetical protein HZA91_17435 [Verrucomicrobia bacterium]|nr:hypothetical protein [Verrucomicrobiota bacterium]